MGSSWLVLFLNENLVRPALQAWLRDQHVSVLSMVELNGWEPPAMAERAAEMGYPYSGSTLIVTMFLFNCNLAEIFTVPSGWHIGVTSVYPIQ